MEFAEKLFQALKKDNLKEFRNCMEQSNCGTLRLGRFPVLSVMYLYKARRLLHAYEKKFLKHNSWRDIGEPMELSSKFRDVAGKCLRIYLTETVSPVEMLLILDKNWKLKRVYSQAHVIPPVKQRLKDIYFVKWGLQAEFVRNKIVLESRPLTRAEKLRWLTATLCVVLCVALVVGTPFVVNAFVPFIPDGSGALNVKWEQIKFDSDKIYALTSDVTLPDNFFVEEMNCELRGNGHKVTVTGGVVFGNINGTLSDIVFETNGSPIVETVTLSATVDKVTVNATINMQTDVAFGFVANDNYGAITNTVANVSGSLTAVAPADEDVLHDENYSFNCGGIVANNNYVEQGEGFVEGLLQNCIANYDNFTLQGQLEANACFGGIVGTNDGNVVGCTVTGAIFANTFDVAGICADNIFLLSNNVNEANVTQVTNVTGWNPYVSGIVLTNNYAVQGCRNYGTITSISTAIATSEEVYSAYSAGIVNRSYGDIYQCANFGAIRAESNGEVYVGGIASQTCFGVVECYSDGSIEASANSCYVGGILGYSFGWDYNGHHLYLGYVQRCVSDCALDVTSRSDDSFVAVGGIVGLVEEWQVTYIDTGEVVYLCGEVSNCYFTGELQVVSDAYAGGIAGVVGKNVYLDSKTSDSPFFDSNMYVDNCGVSVTFGSVVTRDDNFEKVTTDVGAQIATTQQIANDTTYKKIMQIFLQLFQ